MNARRRNAPWHPVPFNVNAHRPQPLYNRLPSPTGLCIGDASARFAPY